MSPFCTAVFSLSLLQSDKKRQPKAHFLCESSFKMRTSLCGMGWNIECNPHCKSPPHVVFVLTDPPTYTAPSIPPSFCCLTLFCAPSLPPLPPASFFFPSWGSVLLSQVWLSTAVVKMGGSDPMLCLPRSLITWPWLLFIPFVGTGLTHLGCVATKKEAVLRGRVKAWQQMKSEVASFKAWTPVLLLSTRRHFS